MVSWIKWIPFNKEANELTPMIQNIKHGVQFKIAKVLFSTRKRKKKDFRSDSGFLLLYNEKESFRNSRLIYSYFSLRYFLAILYYNIKFILKNECLWYFLFLSVLYRVLLDALRFEPSVLDPRATSVHQSIMTLRHFYFRRQPCDGDLHQNSES